ncbi:MAG TPA: hypothetical protein ENH82_00995 [bacterium]|nr:hypothetical protein [bacterium]
MRRPTYKSIKEAAKKSQRAALDSSIEKYVYLLQLSMNEVWKLPVKVLCDRGCAICLRYRHVEKTCPLNTNCKGDCIPEWKEMVVAKEAIRADAGLESYYKFMYYAGQILVKLLRLRGKIK